MNDANSDWECLASHGMPEAEVRLRVARHVRSSWLPQVLPAIRGLLIEEGTDPDRAIVLASLMFERWLSKHLDQVVPQMMRDMAATARDAGQR